MLREKLKESSGNIFAQDGLIPLGLNTFKGNWGNKNRVISINNKKNGSMVVIATSGYGKSVLIRRINEYKLKYSNMMRAGLLIDTQGVDHRLMAYKNDKPFPLFYEEGEKPMNFENIINYCPIFASNKKYEEDIVFGISLKDLTPKDLLSSGMSVSCKDELLKIKREDIINRNLMDNPDRFYEEFSKLPSKNTKENYSISMIVYPEKLINYSIKQSLERYFSVWKGYNPGINEKPEWMTLDRWENQKIPPYFVKTRSKKYKPMFEEEYKQKKIVIANFMDCKEQPIAMAMYGGYLLKDVYDYCSIQKRNNPNFEGMYIFVEEANLFIDSQDRYLEKGSNFYMTEILCRGFKFEMDITASFQSITGSNPQIKEYLTSGSNPVIIGNLINKDRKYLSEIFPDINDINLREKKDLPSGMRWGANEWIIFYNDKYYDTFVPYPCMSAYHKRG